MKKIKERVKKTWKRRVAMLISLSIMTNMMPIGGKRVEVVAEEPGEVSENKPLDEIEFKSTGDVEEEKDRTEEGYRIYQIGASGSDKSLEAEVKSDKSLEAEVKVEGKYGEIEFEWEVESGKGYLRYKLTEGERVIKSGEKVEYSGKGGKGIRQIKLKKGKYQLNIWKDSGSSVQGKVSRVRLKEYKGVEDIPKTMYAAPGDLTDSKNFSLAEENDEKVGEIGFGRRNDAVAYDYEDWSTERTVKAGGIRWLIAGAEEYGDEANKQKGLVLYAKEALEGKTKFNKFSSSGDWDPETGEGYNSSEKDDPPLVSGRYANHWGRSDLRGKMKGLIQNCFTQTESDQMCITDVKTYDYKPMDDSEAEAAVEYITKDKLYAAKEVGKGEWSENNYENFKTIGVGGAGELKVDKAYWGSIIWLRSPHPGSYGHALALQAPFFVLNYGVLNSHPAVGGALRLNLSSVRFTSAASAANPDGQLDGLEGVYPSQSQEGPPMTVRLDGSEELKDSSISKVDGEETKLNYKAAEGETLLVIATTEDKATYQFSVKGTGKEETINIAQKLEELKDKRGIRLIRGGQRFVAKAWIEKQVEENSSLTYATEPINISGKLEKTDPIADDFTFIELSDLKYNGEKQEIPNNIIKPNIENACTIERIWYYDINRDQWSEEKPINAGTYKVKIDVTAGEYYLGGEGITDDNWQFEIKKAELIPDVKDKEVYYGGENVDVSFKGCVEKDSLQKDKDYKITTKFADPNVGENRPVEVTIELMETEIAKNYELKTGKVNTTINIIEKPVTVKAEDKTKKEGEEDPALTYKVDEKTPLVNENDLAGELSREPGEEIGTYKIQQGTLGNSNYKITFEPGTFTITAKEAEQPEPPKEDLHSDWGQQEEHEGIKHWVSTEGTTSVEVNERGIIWLKEESDGTYAWYGLDNSKGIFENGSRFWVRWVTKASNPEEFDKLWAQFDEENKERIESNKVCIFEIGVTRPDGREYTDVGQEFNVYVQIGDDWNKQDLEAYYIQATEDETVHVKYVDNQIYPEGTGLFGKMTLKHFSPYAIFDRLTDEERAKLEGLFGDMMDEEKEDSDQLAVKTGDSLEYLNVTSFVLVVLAVLVVTFNIRLKKKKY